MKKVMLFLVIFIVLFLILITESPKFVGEYMLYERRSSICLPAIEVIYEDDENVYFFGCLQSHNYKLIKPFEIITIKEAINDDKVTIEELMKAIPDIVASEKSVKYNN